MHYKKVIMLTKQNILSRLTEKKDVLIYIDLRICELNQNFENIPNISPSKSRESAKRKLQGRILELKHMRYIANNNIFRKESIRLWRKLNKKEEETK